MYAHRILLSKPTLLSEGVDEDRFPKMIGTQAVSNLQEQQDVLNLLPPLPGDTVVITPEKYIPLVLGRDYNTCVLEVPNTNLTKVLVREVPPPELDESADLTPDSHPILHWEGGYGLPTYIYRTKVFHPFTTDIGLLEFSLIARLPAGDTPGGASSYVDSSIALRDDLESAIYYVQNNNGTSNSVIFTGVFNF